MIHKASNQEDVSFSRSNALFLNYFLGKNYHLFQKSIEIYTKLILLSPEHYETSKNELKKYRFQQVTLTYLSDIEKMKSSISSNRTIHIEIFGP